MKVPLTFHEEPPLASRAHAAGEAARVARVLEDGLQELGLSSPPGGTEKLATLAGLVARWGSKTNLSGHRDADSVARRLILDAAALYASLPHPPRGRIADLGSGAGFPGLPLAVLCPDCEVFLVESRERRHHFQRQAVRELGLQNCTPIRGRFEEVTPEPSDVVVAQAVAAPDSLLPMMQRWATPGGLLVIPTGERVASAAEASYPARATALSYQVPLGGATHRMLLVAAF